MFKEGGYESSERACITTPRVEAVLKDRIAKLLEPLR